MIKALALNVNSLCLAFENILKQSDQHMLGKALLLEEHEQKMVAGCAVRKTCEWEFTLLYFSLYMLAIYLHLLTPLFHLWNNLWEKKNIYVLAMCSLFWKSFEPGLVIAQKAKRHIWHWVFVSYFFDIEFLWASMLVSSVTKRIVMV